MGRSTAFPVPICLLAILVLIPALTSLAQAADPLVLSLSKNPPAQCDTIGLSWTGGSPNYTIQITSQVLPFESPSPVFSAFGLTNTSLTWTVNHCGGEPVTFEASDSGGYKYAITLTIRPSTNTSCLTYGQQNSHECLLESAAQRAPSATSTPTPAPEEGGSSSTVPVVIGFIVTGIVIIAAAFTWRVYRRRRAARASGGAMCSTTRNRGGQGNTLVDRAPPYVRHEDAQIAPPAYAPGRHLSDTIDGDGCALHPASATESVQMTELPRTPATSEPAPTYVVSRRESHATATHSGADTGISRSTGGTDQPRLNGEGRAGSLGDGVEAPPPAYSEV